MPRYYPKFRRFSQVTMVTTIIIFLMMSLAPVRIAAQVGEGAQQLYKERGLVPCGGPYESPCTACDIFQLVQNVLNFVWWYISIPLAALMLAYGGFLMIIPGVGGEKSAPMVIKGKKALTNTIIGIFIVFLAWLIIDTIIKLLVGQGLGGGTAQIAGYGPWNKVNCPL